MAEDGRPLAEVAAELYALPVGEFIVARGAAVKAAKAAGDRDAATAIGAWRKPTSSAWLVNTLTREQVDLVDDLLDLGARLRAAQESLDGAALRTLTKERQQAVAALSRAARAIAQANGGAYAEGTRREVEDTLLAALADERNGAAVRSGQLVTALSAAGFGPVDLDASVAVPQALREKAASSEPAPPTPAPPTPIGRADRARAAQDEWDRVREEADDRAAELDEARADAADAADRLAAAERRVVELEAELRAAKSEAELSRRAGRAAQQGVSDAERADQSARRAVDVARRRAERAGRASQP